MNSYNIEIYTRQAHLYYQPFFTYDEIISFLSELQENDYTIMDEVYGNPETAGISFHNIYYLEISKNGEVIDKFDPTKELNENQIVRESIDLSPQKEMVGYLYFCERLKSLRETSFKSNKDYNRENFSIHLEEYIVRAINDDSVESISNDDSVESISVEDIAIVRYDDEEIEFEAGGSDGGYEIELAVCGTDKKFTVLDTDAELDDIISTIEAKKT